MKNKVKKCHDKSNFDLNTSLLIIYNREKQFLMQLRSANAPIMPSVVGFFGGGINNGEAPFDAAVRESKEELGIVLDYKFYRTRIALISKKYCELAHFYLAKIGDDASFSVYEGEGYVWLDVNDPPYNIQTHDLETLIEVSESLIIE